MTLIANKSIDVVISNDRLTATLQAKPQASGSGIDLSAMDIMNELRAMKIQIADEVAPSIENFILAIKKNENPELLVVARGTPPRNGRDGCLKKLFEKSAISDDQQSYYDQTQYFVAAEGQKLLHVCPPTQGENGLNVQGDEIPHKTGREANVSLGQNVRRDGEYITAACNGVIHFSENKIEVNPKLEIAGNVDFSTGNIHFPGEVVIAKNVVDLFKVQSQSTISIGGVAEAAQIHAARDLIVKGGITGKEKGIFTAKQNIEAKYITNSKVHAGADILVHSEIVNCDLACGGKITVETGALVGGHVFAIGGVKVRELGSEGTIKTILEVGIDPNLIESYEQIETQVRQLRRKAEKTKKIVEPLLMNQKQLNPQQKEKATELLYQANELERETQTMIEKLCTQYNQVCEKAASKIEVLGTVFPGVTIRFPKVEGYVKTPLNGPLVITPQKIEGILQIVAINLNSNTTHPLDSRVDTNSNWESLEEFLGLNNTTF